MAQTRSGSSIDDVPCSTCGKLFPGEWVSCDKCQSWHHFICVGLDEASAKLPWNCKVCVTQRQQKPIGSKSKHPSTTDSPTTTMQLEKQQSRIAVLEKQAAAAMNSAAEQEKKNKQLLEARARDKATFATELEQQTEALRKAMVQQEELFAAEKLRLEQQLAQANQVVEVVTTSVATMSTPTTSIYSTIGQPIFSTIATPAMSSAANQQLPSITLPPINVHSGAQSTVIDVPLLTPEVSATPDEEVSLSDIMKRKHLPRLPEFSGKVRDWPAFENLFNSTTARGKYSEIENIDRLRVALKPPASNLVQYLLMTSFSATAVMQELKKAYGKPEMIQDILSEELLSFPAIKSMTDPSLRLLAANVNNFVATVRMMGKPNYVVNIVIVRKLVTKLPMIYYREWTQFHSAENEDNLETLAQFLSLKVDEIPPEMFDHQPKKSQAASQSNVSGKRVMAHNRSAAPTNNSSGTQPKLKCFNCKREGHGLLECRQFEKMTSRERNRIVSDNKICYICLKGKHLGRDCTQSKRCTHDGCQKYHHPLLHNPPSGANVIDASQQSNVSNNAPLAMPVTQSTSSSHVEASTSHSVMAHNSDESVLFKILPIRIYRADGSYVDTHAFLDDGSSLTLMERELFDDLGLISSSELLHLQWTNGIVREEESLKAHVAVSNVKSKQKHTLVDVYAIKNLDLPTQSLDVSALKSRYRHLQSLPLIDLVDVKPKILIGLRNSTFLLGDNSHVAGDDEPIATKTKLGWVVYGHTCPSLNFSSMNNQSSGLQLSIREAVKTDDELLSLVKHHFSTECFGVAPPTKNLISQENQRALEIMNSTMNFKDGRYEIGLLWKTDNVKLPDSYPMALKRLESLERSLKKDPKLLEWKNNHIRELLSKGYARVATQHDLNHQWPRVWYCPTFVTVNRNKIPPKPRDVADVAAKVSEQSLNTNLLKGPDNLAPLIGGLFKFRERAIAVNADVREMFHQIRIREEDQQCQRFLWRDADVSREPTVYVMERMMFGPTCSPTCAQHVKNSHAAKYAQQFPDAVDGLIYRTYVDDYFQSHRNVTSALKCSREAIQICEDMGFDLTGFQSNSRELLSQLPKEKVKHSLVAIDQQLEPAITKILGMFWDSSSDMFTYKTFKDELLNQMLFSDYRPSKRELLRTQMRIFDPLGLIAHYLIQGRIILQELWLEGTDWDSPIPDNINQKWKSFISQLQLIENIRIPRLYTTIDPSDSHVRLVVFVDASEAAFSAVAYLHCTLGSEVQVALVMGKAKVAPTKRLTIPQLELQAAVLGTRLANTVKKLHPFTVHETMFLSDSKVTLLWIGSRKYEFKIFVAARVGEILESSSKSDWFHVGTKENVADDATRWENTAIGDNETRWFHGPSFLLKPRDDWPIIPMSEVSAKEDKIPKSIMLIVAHADSSMSSPHPIDEISSRFQSNWSRLVRVVAFLRRWRTRKARHVHFVTPEEFREAEDTIFKKIQADAFAEDVLELQSSNNSLCSGKLKKFVPKLQDGLIRMSSRAELANITYAARCPVILPSRHPLVTKFVEHFHEANFHLGEEMTIADVKNRAWVIDTRSAVRRVKRNCQQCKNNSARPIMPIMGQLPPARLDFSSKPFSNVGIDAFGPYNIRFGRGSVKRYGLIFTCLTFRAVHLEVLDDMSTEHCIMAIKRFMSRRGWCQQIFSDNGKNFVGASNVLCAKLAAIQKELGEKVSHNLLIKWNFIPAYSPWFGGAWERLIQSVKHCIDYVMREETPTESAFGDALIEAEMWMNRRPLTHIPVDPEDPEPLTPNTALFGNRQDELAAAAGTFNAASEAVSKKRAARRTQHLVDKFLGRWTREYLPSIMIRDKWHRPTKPVEVGDIAILVDPSQPRNAWSLCRVISTHKGSDDRIRAVDVELPDKTIKRNRSVGRIAILDVKPDVLTPAGMSATEESRE